MRRILIAAITLLLIYGNVLAHDGTEHVSKLEQWVIGIGIVLILATSIYSLYCKPSNMQSYSEFDSTPRDSHSENIQ